MKKIKWGLPIAAIAVCLLTAGCRGIMGAHDEETQPHVHAFGEWTLVTPPTCAMAGLQERSCACGETEQCVISVREHDMVDGKCINCGKGASTGLEYSLIYDEDIGSDCWGVTGIGTCTDTDIVIPAKHEGRPVTAIGDDAFVGNKNLTSVTIPDGVTIIGYEAFCNCTGLMSVTIPNGVTSIGDRAFEQCSSLTRIVIPDSVTYIGQESFYQCENLANITMSQSATIIRSAAFTLTAYYYDESNWLDGVLYIGPALIDCKKNDKIGSVIIKDGTTCIAGGVFSGCSRLTNITIPDSVTSIGANEFYACLYLTSITFTGTQSQWEAIEKGYKWKNFTGSFTVHCTDGDISYANA